ncbi:MAG TPA: hypothetical protein HA282_00525 [Nanoarchaeota archaeon]|nr:hypothetical protein [Candidatus Pacearchaeota archaeon]HIH17736.1 hypothetical protein [Nanoarchaeota archaeon]HIH33800.1 hypothetical protein [Nanoarchaeota archaeon]HIH51621.1 hypothetical protein [Nanoarchaeota archaeon]HIH65686.1 hypothetical protein [Nanoarchaeota archaeon]
MLIGVDIDDVLAEFVAALCPFHNEKYGTSLTKKDIFSYDFSEVWGGTGEEAVQKILEFQLSSEFKELAPVKGAQKATRNIDLEHDLITISSRPKVVYGETWRWLDYHFSSTFSELHFTNEVHRQDGEPLIRKTDICKELGVDVLIDDYLKTTLACAEQGIPALLIDQPWNRAMSLPEKVTRVYSWQEIQERIEDRNF